jgi:hypothetical protein
VTGSVVHIADGDIEIRDEGDAPQGRCSIGNPDPGDR